jgi:hypothetical protein
VYEFEWSDGFDPQRFTLPAKGKDLQAEMAELEKLANEEEDDDDQGQGAGLLTDLPKSLVESVLALPPMARASMSALIAGSLADELEHARSVVQQVVSAARAPKRGRHGVGRKRHAR